MQPQLKYYSEQGVFHAMNVYREIDHMPLQLRTRAIRYLYQFGHRIPRISPNRKEMDNTLQRQFVYHQRIPEAENQSTAFELMDIALQFSPQIGREMLHTLRREETELKRKRQTFAPAIEGTVYADTQNVHNSKFNQSVKDVATKISSDYPQWKNIMKDPKSLESVWNTIRTKLMRQCDIEYRPTLDKVISDIRENPATFGIQLRVEELLIAVWYWHLDFKGEYRNTIESRMAEEMLDMKGYCSTGHLARLMNVLQGFDDRYHIGIGVEDQCKSVVYHYLTTLMQDCTDDSVTDAMISQDRTLFVDYIQEHIRTKSPEWEDEYGTDFMEYVHHYTTQFIN